MILSNENKDNTTSCGLLIVRKAPEANTFAYTFTVFLIVLEGELGVEDQAKPGEQINLKTGDIVRIDQGTDVKWTSPSYGKAFFVAEVAHDVNAHELLV